MNYRRTGKCNENRYMIQDWMVEEGSGKALELSFEETTKIRV
jgi:hypothetical protein